MPKIYTLPQLTNHEYLMLLSALLFVEQHSDNQNYSKELIRELRQEILHNTVSEKKLREPQVMGKWRLGTMKAYQKIREYLQVNDITESELSRKSGIPKKRIHSLLTGKTRMQFKTFVRICTALNASPNDLLSDKSDNQAFHELMRLIMKLSDENIKRLLSFTRGLSKNENQEKEVLSC